MRRILSLAGFCLIGIATDTGVVLYWRAIQNQRRLMAIILTFILTIVPLLIAKKGITERRVSIFVSYATGASIGTALGMMIRL